MRPTFRFASASVAVALLVVTASFVSSALLVARDATKLDAHVRTLTEHALPSIAVATRTRAWLDSLVMGRRSDAEVVWREAAAEWARADAIAPCPQAAPARAVVTRELSKLGRAAAPDAAPRGPPELASLNEALAAVIHADVRHADMLTTQIAQARAQTTWLAMGLEVASVALAAIIGPLVFLAMRGYARATEARATELEQFAFRVAHDVIAPLAGTKLVLGFTQKQPVNEDTQRMLRLGVAGLDRTQRIVDGLLAFALAGAQPEPDDRADVSVVISDVVEAMAPEASSAGIALQACHHVRCAVACKDGVLTAMLSNLIQNAMKYMGDAKTRVVHVEAREDKDCIVIQVADSGPGLGPERDTVFNPYIRGSGAKSKPGIGLGLATVRRMATAHHGNVGYRHRQGGGSVFWFSLPKARGAARASWLPGRVG